MTAAALTDEALLWRRIGIKLRVRPVPDDIVVSSDPLQKS
jgi:hypothetical protein